MPDLLEISAYRLGIRLVQCQVLHRAATTYKDHGPGELAGNPGNIAAAVISVKALDDAFKCWAKAGELTKNQIDMLRSNIQYCWNRWKIWKKCDPIELSQNGPDDDQTFYKSINNLREGILNTIPVEKNNVRVWFLLGISIADGEWNLQPHRRRVCRTLRLPESTATVAEIVGDMQWELNDELEANLRSAGQEFDKLYSDIGEGNRAANLLVYDIYRYRPWFRIEAGLSELEEECADIVILQNKSPKSNSNRGRPMNKVTMQRVKFASPLRKKGHTWPEIHALYIKGRTHRNDLTVTPDKLRMAVRAHGRKN